MGLSSDPNSCGSLAENNLIAKMRAGNNDSDANTLIDSSVASDGVVSYTEKWSLHPGEALRRKRGISAKEQQALAKNPVTLAQDIFESDILRNKAFYADENCLIFCRECGIWLDNCVRLDYLFADCIVTSPLFFEIPHHY